MAEQPITLTPDQVKRYSRHIIMSDVGSKGQRALMGAKALIIGAGGLGSPSAIYLSLAGVGTVGIVDFDVVELSNLQRQVLHHTADVGRPKVQSAYDNIKSYNPDVFVQSIGMVTVDRSLQELGTLRHEIELIERIGANTVMWGSDFPHPDGTWPDSRSILEPQVAALPEETRRRVVGENAAELYGFAISD